jgi:hypothetical protein
LSFESSKLHREQADNTRYAKKRSGQFRSHAAASERARALRGRAPDVSMQKPRGAAKSARALSDLAQPAFFTGGGDQVPSRIEGGVSFGQYIRIIRMNWSLGAGSQLAWGTFAGLSWEK